jgi:predicted esterase
MTRRTLLAAIPAAGAGVLIAQRFAERKTNRFTARPQVSAGSAPAGLRPLGLRTDRDALLYVPASSEKHEKAPLIVSLHGATRGPERGIDLLKTLSDEHGFLLLAPGSAGHTWDIIEDGGYGADIGFIDKSLARVFEMRTIDPVRIAMAGFSDGASYSLSVGLANGDLFTSVFGFSPGFVVPGEHAGKPPVFISHGTIDPVLPIDECSRRIVPELKRQGYQVTYREFEGKHALPPDVAQEAMRWFLKV